MIMKLLAHQRINMLPVICLSLCILTGCQKTLTYSPHDWHPSQDKLWKKSFENYDIEIGNLQGRRQGNFLAGVMILKPKTNKKITFIEVTLQSKKLEKIASRMVDKQTSERGFPEKQYLMWDFNTSLKEIMEEPVRLKITLALEPVINFKVKEPRG